MKYTNIDFNGTTADKLIQGQPYLYLKDKGQGCPVLYQRIVRLPNGVNAYNFRFQGYKAGFVNLTEEELKHYIFPYQ